jgi:hypothetical protein
MRGWAVRATIKPDSCIVASGAVYLSISEDIHACGITGRTLYETEPQKAFIKGFLGGIANCVNQDIQIGLVIQEIGKGVYRVIWGFHSNLRIGP